ncbi:hypothetical protein SAMN05878281_2880 [Salegentibacter salegens]|uniref:Uncharacterized protein n=1 Tax=Salegentibacter salegens TaxID=143223 RepID=A0A1M7N543_9FLAO|nr:hypothetical protein LY58_01539 [Salegentibacter salegens]SHM98551.1 hypothetical protein SAMN05878281_2880 [Salegentibacter salegens]
MSYFNEKKNKNITLVNPNLFNKNSFEASENIFSVEEEECLN